MKLLVIGTILVLYAVFLTPCFIEPTDVIISTGYIAIANERGIDPILIWLWIMSGYVALVVGLFLGIGGSVIHFKSADNRIELEIDSNVCRVEVR